MLTELCTIKTRLGLKDSDVVDDAILTNALAAVSARFENFCNRKFGRTVAAQDEFQGDETELRLSIYPVEAVTLFEMKANETDGFVAVDPSQFEFVIRKNCILSLVQRLGTTRQVVRVTYTGGFVLPADQNDDGSVPAGQTALPADLEQACVEQVAYWYQNRSRLGLVSISGEGGSISQYAQLDLLPSVKAVCKKYERWMP